jgi:hypothetical protein
MPFSTICEKRYYQEDFVRADGAKTRLVLQVTEPSIDVCSPVDKTALVVKIHDVRSMNR